MILPISIQLGRNQFHRQNVTIAQSNLPTVLKVFVQLCLLHKKLVPLYRSWISWICIAPDISISAQVGLGR